MEKLAACMAALMMLTLVPAALGQADQISAQATYLEELDKYLQSLPASMTEITYNEDGSIAKTVTFDPAGCNKRTVVYNADGTRSVMVQACSQDASNTLTYQLDQNGAVIPGTKTISTTSCVPLPACAVKPTPPPTPTPTSTGSDVIVVKETTNNYYYNYCETTKQWEQVEP